MEQLVAVIAVAEPQEGGRAALQAGGLIEHGEPVRPLVQALETRLPQILEQATRFLRAAREAFPDALSEQTGSGVRLGDSELPVEWVQSFAAEDYTALASWVALDWWCLPMIAALTREPAERARLSGLREDAEPLVREHGTVQFFDMMLAAPSDESLLFVDQRTRRAFELKMDGVAVNFELHTLLGVALAQPLGLQPPDPASIAALFGELAAQAPHTVGMWNLYDHRALSTLDAGEEVGLDKWVWNEGRPEDIPKVDGTRLVVAGAPPYERTWQTTRTFQALMPKVELVRELTPDEAAALLAQLG